MTDLKDQLTALFDDEPPVRVTVGDVVGRGQRARRRRRVWEVAGGAGVAAAVTAAIVLPVTAAAHRVPPPARIGVAAQPTPAVAKVHCGARAVAGAGARAKGNLGAALRSIARQARLGKGEVIRMRSIGVGKDHKLTLHYCVGPKSVLGAGDYPAATPTASGPPYTYTESPQAIATRLADELNARVTALSLEITYTRPFSQEADQLDAGKPSYFEGNVDVHEQSGYADIDVQVRHASTQQETLDGQCDGTGFADCQQTKLADGSVLRTQKVRAGKGLFLLTADLAHPDGLVVHAQESNYPFGPDSPNETHGDLPLTLDQLVALAEDPHFIF